LHGWLEEGVVLFAVVAAFTGAACFGAGSALQHRVASASSASEESERHFFARLLRRPSWLIGQVLSAMAFCFHALALSKGDLALVQPVIVSGIVFSVLIRAGLDRRWPARRTMIWLVLTWAGLALFLLVRPSATTNVRHSALAPLFVLGGCLLVMVAMLMVRRSEQDRLRGLLLGSAAGVLYGLVAGLVKLILGQASKGVGQVFTHWTLWTFLAVGAWAIVLNQRAYQATRISVTVPALNISQVIVAIAFGILALGEQLGSSVGVVAGEVVGLAVTIFGVRNLAALPTDSGDAKPAKTEPIETSR
jgi:drug/metabolite transporter (DMT)-like permease